MNKHSRLTWIMAIGITVPVLVGLYRQMHHSDLSLYTAMDVPAAEPVDNEATGAQVIDTTSEQPQKTESDFENTQKRKDTMALVEEALTYIKNNTFDSAMNAFTHGREFIRGELYLFVYDTNGFQFASGLDERWVWKNWHNERDTFGTPIVQEMVKVAKNGGGWLTYQWRNTTKVSYVKLFSKDGKEYVIGAGYYPHSKRDIVVSLVKAAAAYFTDVVIKKDFPVDEVFSTLSYPAGRFVMGDLYLYAVDTAGQMVANGDRPGLIGTNVLNIKDAEGKFVNQEIINKLKTTSQGIWIEYKSKNATKLTYAQKVADKNGKEYFIACGYYPDATPQKAVDLVKNGYEFMKKHGISASVTEFTSRQVDTYRYGDLYLVVWNMKGAVIAHGNNPDSIGLNQYDLKDEDGKYYVREVIEKAKKGGGWIDFKMKNAFQSIYVEKVDLGTDSFVIGCGLYPISKREMALLLARSAAGYLRSHPQEEAYNAFSDVTGKFIRGDLYVFAIDYDGIVMVWGDNYELIWRNLMSAKDDNGKPYVQIFINTVKQGAAQISFKLNGYERIAFLEPVEKDGRNFVVGTGYYL